MVTRSFTRAGENTWLLGLSLGLDAVARGLTVWFDMADGRNAVDGGGGAALPDDREYEIGAVWTYREKGSVFDGTRLRTRAAWVYDDAPGGTQRGTDYRIDLN